jgi:hypothetical protein
MIHSAATVPSENFELQTASGQRKFPLPAEYYSTPPGDRRPLVAPWAPMGCGIASIVLLLLVFGGGYLAAHGGAAKLMELLLARSRADIATMYSRDVTPAQRKQLDLEMSALQKNIAARRVKLEALQPILRDMRDAMLDNVVTSEETNRLIRDFAAANAAANAATKSP